MIEFADVSKRFPGTGGPPAVDRVSLNVEKGETVVLLGSSGSGKSTLLRMVNGLVRPDSGTVRIHGTPVERHDPVQLRRATGYVMQETGLFPHWTIAENVAAVPRIQGMKPAERRRLAARLLEKVRLDPEALLDRFPDELSGGQQQRAGVARALAANPACLLMDEPFGAVDGITREALQDLVKELRTSLEMTILFVTHDLFEALALADRIAVLHEGRLEQAGVPGELIRNPAGAFVRDLFAKPARQLEVYRKHKE